MRHFQALVRLDTSDPPGHEAPAVEYLKRILEAEGIETKIFALDPKRPNLVARLRGNGSKRPLSSLHAFADSWHRLVAGCAPAPTDSASAVPVTDVRASERAVREDTGDDTEQESRTAYAAEVIR